VQHYFGGMKSIANGAAVAVPAFIAGTQSYDRAIAQDHIALGFTSPPILDDRRQIADVLGNVLGGGSTSRLFERIREDEGLAYSVYAFHSPFAMTGMLGVYAAVNPENLRQTLDITSEELRKLRDAPVTDAELQSNKEQLKGGLLLALEGTFNRMARLARSLMYFNEIKTIDEIIAEIDAVTAEQVQHLAQEVFVESNCALSVLGPATAQPPALTLG
jgi:predicted Zn-dependent peptidase